MFRTMNFKDEWKNVGIMLSGDTDSSIIWQDFVHCEFFWFCSERYYAFGRIV
jgi:hypothetical protein